MRSRAVTAAVFMVSFAPLVSCGSSSKPGDSSVTPTATGGGTPSDGGVPSGGGTPAGDGTPSGDGATPGDGGATPVHSGRTLWAWTSGMAGIELATGIFPGPGGTSYVAATANPPPVHGPYGLLLAALDAGGATTWSRVYGADAGVGGRVLSGLPDGHIVAVMDSYLAESSHYCAPTAENLGVSPCLGGLVELSSAGDFVRLLLRDAHPNQLTDNTWTPVGEVFVIVGGTPLSPSPVPGAPYQTAYEIRKLRADGTEIWHRNLGTVNMLIGTPHGGAYAVIVPSTSPQQIVMLEPVDGAMRWTRAASDKLERITSLKDGALAGTRVAASGAHELFVLEPDDGRERGSVEVPIAKEASLLAGALPGGGVVVTEILAPGEVRAPCPVLRAYSASLAPLWTRSLDLACSPGETSTITVADWNGLLPTNNGRLLVTGTVRAHADFGDSHVVDPVAGSDAFAIEIDPR